MRRGLIVVGLALALLAGAEERGLQVSGQATPADPSGPAPPRLALVVGNGAYAAAPLRNPPADARQLAAVLREAGFEVLERVDLDRSGLREAIREFASRLRPGGVGLFYFAGHGLQVRGENYLVPVDADIRAEDEIDDEGVKASLVLEKMEAAGSRLNLVILDACRDNPFTRGSRSASRGLAVMDAPSGTLLAYATAPGSVAADGEGGNGLYTSTLLRHIRTPGLGVERLFRVVRREVMQASDGRQVPWESTSLTGDFSFFAPDPGAAGPEAPASTTDREATARLRVLCNVPDCSVSVDGHGAGSASPQQPLELVLPARRHEVQVASEGYRTHRESVALLPDEALELSAMLQPQGGRLAPLPPAGWSSQGSSPQRAEYQSPDGAASASWRRKPGQPLESKAEAIRRSTSQWSGGQTRMSRDGPIPGAQGATWELMYESRLAGVDGFQRVHVLLRLEDEFLYELTLGCNGHSCQTCAPELERLASDFLR